jgi:predicted dehydrogenase
MSIGVGIIGCGVVGQMRAQAVGKTKGIHLVAVADPDSDARAKIAGVERFDSYRDLLEKDDIQAVIVSTPPPFHEEMVLTALDAGKHVLCEKPLAVTEESCRAMVDRAAKHELALAVGFNHRYYPCVKELKRAMREERVGEIHHVRALCGHQGVSEFRADWMYKSEFSGGGAMMDIGIHLTDLVGHLFGRVEKVFGTASNHVWQVEGSEDHAAASFITEQGIPVAYHATWAEWKGYRLVLEVYGHEGVHRAFYAPMVNMHAKRGGRRGSWNLHPWVNLREKFVGWETTGVISFTDELTDFVSVLNGGEWGSLADGSAGLHAVQVAGAVYESSKSGDVVTVAG